MLSSSLLEESLQVLGAALADRGQSYELVAVGGGSLLLLGLLARPTADLDIVALVEEGHYVKPEGLPLELENAVQATARVMGIRQDWINLGPTDLLDFGLPEGFALRTSKRQYGSLVLHLAGRRDQIFLKLYAAVDQGRGSKHFEDLLQLEPTPEELLEAADWTTTHDPSPGFRQMLNEALKVLGVANDGVSL